MNEFYSTRGTFLALVIFAQGCGNNVSIDGATPTSTGFESPEVEMSSLQEDQPFRAQAFSGGAEYFVAKDGKDSANCLTISTPCESLAGALAKVRTQLSGGKLANPVTINVRRGVYRELPPINGFSGSAKSNLVIRSYNNETVVLDGRNVKSPGIRIKSSNYLSIIGIEVRNASGAGIVISNSSFVTLRELLVHNNGGSGIRSASGNRNKFLNIVSHSNIDTKNQGENADGIALSSGQSHEIRNCKVYNNSDDGIDTWMSQNNLVEGNESYGNGLLLNGDGSGFKLGPGVNGVSGNRVIRNSAHNNRGPGFSNNLGSGNVFVDNTSTRNGN